MIFNRIILKKLGEFISLYIANYTNNDGEEKNYEIVSRHELKTCDDLKKKQADAVTIIAFSEDGEKILLQKEFRLTINDYVWSFPAGLIDENESPIDSAKRELKEETGLDLTKVLYQMPPCYTSVGISNEMIIPIYCHAKGKFSKSSSAMEEIKAKWFSKEELRKMIIDNENNFKTNKPFTAFTNRTSAIVYNWVGII